MYKKYAQSKDMQLVVDRLIGNYKLPIVVPCFSP